MKTPYFKTRDMQFIYLDHVYLEYDGPVFFLCSDEFNSTYLGAASISTEKYYSWTLVKVSESRLQSVLKDKITLYDLFKNSETGSILLVKSTHGDEFDSVEEIPVEQIGDDLLPAKDAYLEASKDSLQDCDMPPQQSEEAFLEKAIASSTTLCDLEIVSISNKDEHAIPARTAGELLAAMDSLRLSLLLGKGTESGRVTNRRADANEVDLCGAAAASMVFKLRARRQCFTEDAVSDSFNALHSLLAFERKSDEYDIFISAHNFAVISHYKRFASVLIQGGYEVGIRTAFPYTRSIKEIHLSAKGLRDRKLMLDQSDDSVKESITMTGLLCGIEPMKRVVFSFFPDGAEGYVSGKIEPVYAEQIAKQIREYGTESFKIPSHGEIGLTKIIRYSPSLSKDTVSYEMSSFTANP